MLSIVSSHTCKLLYNRITYHMSLLMKTLTHLHIQSFLPKPGFEPTRTYVAPLYGPTRYVQRHHNASGHTVYIGW